MSKRLHLEDQIMKSELMSKAFATICALLHTTDSKDLECDIQFGDKQYHFDVSVVEEGLKS